MFTQPSGLHTHLLLWQQWIIDIAEALFLTALSNHCESGQIEENQYPKLMVYREHHEDRIYASS